jgi:hypothetical protein
VVRNWKEAWTQFETLLALDPTYQDAQQRPDEALWETIEHVAGGDDWGTQRLRCCSGLLPQVIG